MLKSTKSHIFIRSALSTNATSLSHCTRSTTYKDVKHAHATDIEANSVKPEPTTVAAPLLTVFSTYETASAQEKLSKFDSDELVNEIPGGFENINELSAPCSHEDSSDYFEVEELEQYVGLDWEDIEVNSDSECSAPQNMLKCSECGHHFKNQVQLNAHQLGEHAFQEVFRCPIHGCDSKYKKSSMLKSHLKKKHPEYWQAKKDVLQNEKWNLLEALQ